MTYQAQLMEMVLKGQYNLPVLEQLYAGTASRYRNLSADERAMMDAMYALQQSTVAPRDERYPASNWKETQ